MKKRNNTLAVKYENNSRTKNELLSRAGYGGTKKKSLYPFCPVTNLPDCKKIHTLTVICRCFQFGNVYIFLCGVGLNK